MAIYRDGSGREIHVHERAGPEHVVVFIIGFVWFILFLIFSKFMEDTETAGITAAIITGILLLFTRIGRLLFLTLFKLALFLAVIIGIPLFIANL